MISEFKLPDVGEGITEGELVEWRVSVGAEVEEDQILAHIETDKAIVEIPSPRKGIILELHHREGEVIPVGETLVTIGDREDCPEGEERSDAGTVVGKLEEAPQPDEESGRILATPALRKKARDKGVDLAKVEATGPGGRITDEDLERALNEKKAGVKRGKDSYGTIIEVPLRGVRKSVARNMSKSLNATAQVTHIDEADMTELVAIKEKEGKSLGERGKKLTYLPFILKAVIIGLKEYSFLNSSMDDEKGEIVLKKYYNVGISVDTKDGLIVPVIKDADKKSILRIAESIEDLAARARSRELKMSELKGGTFTITNIGSYGGIYATPIINHPEAAILATGRIREKAVVLKGEVAVRKILPLSLSFDHRILDGAMAAKFLKTVIRHLEDPGLLLLELS